MSDATKDAEPKDLAAEAAAPEASLAPSADNAPAAEETAPENAATPHAASEPTAAEAASPFAPAPSAAAGPSLHEVLAVLNAHQDLMVQWLNAVRQDVQFVYQRLDTAAGQILAAQHETAQAASQHAPLAAPPQGIAVAPHSVAPHAASPQPGAPAAQPASVFDMASQAAAALVRAVPGPPTAAAAPVPQAASAAHDVLHWEGMVFGPELAGQGRITHERAQVIAGLREGDSTAQALAGHLLIFRSAPAEKLPVLLKDLGEAYYRWRPETANRNDPLRDALIAWAERQCEKFGLLMKIELVRPGDRYDSKRHNAKDPGVEVTEVHGWVVLRDSGKIYTKANVAAR